MIFVYIVVVILAVLFSLWLFGVPVTSSAKKPMRGLSWPARQIVEKYNKIPENNRPSGDIVAIVRALDIKHGTSNVNVHFKNRYADGSSWQCDGSFCRKRESDICHDYRELYNSLRDVITALNRQKHALEIAGVSDKLDEAARMVESLREEKKIISEITRELA